MSVLLAQRPVLSLEVPVSPGSAEIIDLRVRNMMKPVYLEATKANLEWLFNWTEKETITVGRKRKERPASANVNTSMSSGEKEVFFSRKESCWYCRGPLGTKLFKVNGVGPDGTPLSENAYRTHLDAQKERAEKELRRQKQVPELAEASQEAVAPVVRASESRDCDSCDEFDGVQGLDDDDIFG